MTTRLDTIAAVVLLAGVAIAGCQRANNSGSPPATEKSESASAASPATPFAAITPARRYDEPGEAVHDFLVAVRSGDVRTATSLLTIKAQEEAWRHGLGIAADGFPQAQFNVSQVEVLSPTEAHVLAVWTEVDDQNQAQTFECVWLLGLEAHGWSISGMATKFMEQADPIVLNFENQAEMAARQRWAEEQIARAKQGDEDQTRR